MAITGAGHGTGQGADLHQVIQAMVPMVTEAGLPGGHLWVLQAMVPLVTAAGPGAHRLWVMHGITAMVVGAG